MNELFRMNEHGDIWQEPTLFDQGREPEPVPEHVFGRTMIREDGTDYVAFADCSCGETVSGRCCSPQSAQQWLTTNKYHHRNADRAPFQVVAQLTL